MRAYVHVMSEIVCQREEATDIANVDAVEKGNHKQDGQHGQHMKIAFSKNSLFLGGINWLPAVDGRILGYSFFLEEDFHCTGI